MVNEQMGMPAAAPSPEEMAVFDQMRQAISPKEFSDEMLATASQADPQAVAEFKKDLEGLDIPPEVLDALNDAVDEILARPEQYAELRKQYMEMGLPEDILPEQFDPQFFAALNMAIDQMIAAPAGPQAFAKGGIAELKPIAKALASYGRNGDTMLAHITPAEARMLKRRGGSGTINPDTGLPEFFLKKVFKAVGKAFKSVGKAVKKFVNSSVGRLVTTVALGFFLGPAAASMLGVSSAAGVAAVSGFVGSAGSTLLGGGSVRDALKAGAIGGLTAGAGAGIMGGSGAFASGSYTGPTTVGGQWDKFTNAITPGAPAAPAVAPEAAVPTASPAPTAELPAASPGPVTAPVDATALEGSLAKPVAPPTAVGRVPTIGESLSTIKEGIGLGEGPASFDTVKRGLGDLFMPQAPAQTEINAVARDLMSQNPGMSFDTALKQASSSMTPSVLRTYGPMVGAGLGIMGLTGGFSPRPVQGGPITQSLMTPATDRIRQQGTERQYYVQGLPGVQYNDRGEPIAGGFTGSLPTYGLPNYGVPLPQGQGQGVSAQLAQQGALPPWYLMPIGGMSPLGYADGGTVGYFRRLFPSASTEKNPTTVTSLYNSVLSRDPSQSEVEFWQKEFGTGAIDEAKQAKFRDSAQAELTQRADAQRAARAAVEQQNALRRAQGYGAMYANINSGLSAYAPEVNPLNAADVQFGAQNRAAQQAALMQAYGPMFANQQNFLAQQAARYGYQPVASMGTSGIATLAQGGYPRRNGQIDGPGTETSDSIPAMLSDGEFVMTAKAVRGAGNGSRREGAKKMYKLMHQLERNAQRG